MPELTQIADGLCFPEGPIACEDGSILLVEIEARRLTRITADGGKHTVATLEGGPNGAAFGPDGRVYLCNNGGMTFVRKGQQIFPGHEPLDAPTGWIEAVDLATGQVSRLYDRCGELPLRAPNDLVFDAHGGFWVTDLGKTYRSHGQRDRGAIYYATADGRSINRVVFPLEGPNGIGLSPDGATLYAAETITGRIWSFALDGPGRIKPRSGEVAWEQGRLHWSSDYYCMLDSLAVDAEGNVCVADIPRGGVTVVSPQGQRIEQYPMPDPITTNVCFGGPDRRTAYITLSSTGKLVSMPWPRQGLKLNWAR